MGHTLSSTNTIMVVNGGILWNSAVAGISRHRNDYRLVGGGLSKDPQECRDLGGGGGVVHLGVVEYEL